MSFYERLTKLMKDRNISQAKLEKEIGISNGSVSKWRNSIPTPKTLKKLADFFGVDSDYLLTGEEKAHTDSIAAEYIDVMDMYARLSDEEKEQVVNMMKLFLKNK